MKRVVNASAICDHVISTNHDFEIIGGVQSNNDFHLRIKESLLISRDKPQLNIAVSSTALELFQTVY